MNLYSLSWKNLLARPLNTLISVLLFALGVGLIVVVLLVSSQLEGQMDKNKAGIGMVVGAKGSPLQLILCSIFHIDFPTGNIPLKETEFLKKHPLVAATVPQALGDSYKGFRIVGTTPEYAAWYQAELEEGKMWESDLEVTVGSVASKALKLKTGDHFEGQHGMGAEGDGHDHHHFKVVGILKPTGTVIDQLILTNVGSVWKVHEHAEEEEKEEEKEITSLLVKFRNPMGAISLPRMINEKTNLQAASPAFEISRLYSLMGVGVEALQYLAFIILGVSGFSVFISLYNSLKDRKYELAYLRVIGARPIQLFGLILLEGLLLTAFGFGLGLGLGHLGMVLLSVSLSAEYHYVFTGITFLEEELWLFTGAILIGFFASVLPAFQAFNTEVSETLSRG